MKTVHGSRFLPHWQAGTVHGEKGLTLIEVLVAIAVLAIGLLGVAMMQYMAIGGNAFGREMQIATEVGQERLEIIKSSTYASVVTNPPPPLTNVPMTNAGAYFWLSEAITDPDPSRYGGVSFTRLSWVVDNCRDINVGLIPTDTCNLAPGVACANAMANTRAIAVRTCWVDKNGGNHSVTLTGLKWNETATP